MRLVIEDQAGTRTIVPFSADEIVIGRAAVGIGWRLPDRNVSRRHARFTRASGNIFVEDLGSLTGTRLNGERISARRRVRPGDLVEIGDFDLVVLSEELVEAGPGTPPPLPAVTRPDPTGVARSPTPAGATAAAADPTPGIAATAPVAAPAAPARRGRLLAAGAWGLAGGLVFGFLLRRLLH
jgi:predicted component of type VI protein secretion system